jgi:nucleoside 2-deoxyribosyltransferase
MNRSPFFLRDEKISVDPKFLFVILPFKNTIVFEKVIKPIAEAADLRLVCKKADDLFTTSTVMQDIANSLRRASLVVADLTGRNPNVFYELGLAHAFRKPVVLLAQSDEDVPADLRAHRYYRYSLESTEEIRHFEETIRSVLNSELESSFVVTEFLDSVEILFARGNEILIDSSFLSQDEGSFAIWALVADVHDQLYPPANHMYIVAHTTSRDGLQIKKTIEQTNEPGENPEKREISFYPNVFAIRRIIKHKPEDTGGWAFWYNGNDNVKQEIAYREELSKGWHLFTVTWSRQADFIKFFIDDRHIGTRLFLSWPEETSRNVFIGTWPHRVSGNWFNSSVGPWRIYRNAIPFEELRRFYTQRRPGGC